MVEAQDEMSMLRCRMRWRTLMCRMKDGMSTLRRRDEMEYAEAQG